jgi:transcriptional regulator with XRE-family HTH domain
MGRKAIPKKTPEAEMLQNIRMARIRLNMSQAAVARQLGISQRTMSSYESGETTMSIDVLLKLPAVFGVSIADLLPSSVVTAVDQRRSRDPKLEEVVINWPELSEQGREAIRNFARLVYDAETALVRAGRTARASRTDDAPVPGSTASNSEARSKSG